MRHSTQRRSVCAGDTQARAHTKKEAEQQCAAQAMQAISREVRDAGVSTPGALPPTVHLGGGASTYQVTAPSSSSPGTKPAGSQQRSGSNTPEPAAEADVDGMEASALREALHASLRRERVLQAEVTCLAALLAGVSDGLDGIQRRLEEGRREA